MHNQSDADCHGMANNEPEADVDYEHFNGNICISNDIFLAMKNEKLVSNGVKESHYRLPSEQRSDRQSVTESEVSTQIDTSSQYMSVPYGLILRTTYEHGKRCADIMGVTYNERMRHFVILDSKGITTWKRDEVEHRATRALSYPKYEYRLITEVIYAKKYNCYFVLGKDFSLKVYNRDFVETCSINANLRSVLFMLFNPVRDELITGGVSGTKVWQFHQHLRNSSVEFNPHSNFGLTLKYELPNVGGSWVKRVELDYHLEHLYCCSDHDLCVYNLEGHQLFKFERAHSMSITGCRYSRNACVLLTSSLDTEVKVWSLMGGLVHIFRGHSRAVTNLILHPVTSSIAVTCSLDGSVRMWSLDTLDCLYSVVVSVDGIQWMGLTDDNLLFLSTPRTLSLWHLNYTVQFWALARSSVTKLVSCGFKDKTTQIMAISEDSSVRLMARSNRKNLCTVLPPPDLSPLQQVMSVCYCREFNIVYMLINHHEIWVYTTRTDPACRIAVWNMKDIQKKFTASQKSVSPAPESDQDQINQPSEPQKLSQVGSRNEGVAKCCCVAVIAVSDMFVVDDGDYTARDSYLLVGLEDGRVLFMDPIIKGQKYLEFKTCKEPVLDMYHDVSQQALVTFHRYKDRVKILVWSLPDLVLQHEIYAPADLTDYAIGGDVLVTGHKCGCVSFHILGPETQPGIHKTHEAFLDAETKKDNHKPEHQASVVAVDVCKSLRLFCSCSDDGAIKIWHDLALLTEIMVDSSLTAAGFLNNRGDLLLGYQKHMFYIDHSKVCPQLTIPESDVESFDKESHIHEDPAVLYEGVTPNTDPISLAKYLMPFDVEFSKDFLEGRVTLEFDHAEEEEVSDDEESLASRAPTEIYFSPVTTPRRRFSTVDLLLGSDISKYDLLKHMKKTLDHLAEKTYSYHCRKKSHDDEEEEMRHERKRGTDFQEDAGKKLDMRFSFPQFGKSPGPTPEFSAPTTPEVFSEPEEETQDHEEITPDNTTLENLCPTQILMPENDVSKNIKTEDKVKADKISHEPVVIKTKFGFSDIKIDAKALMKNVSKARPMAATPTAIARPQIQPEILQMPKKKSGQREAPVKKKMLVNSQRKSRKFKKPEKQTLEKINSAEGPPTQIQAIEIQEHRLQIQEQPTKDDEVHHQEKLNKAFFLANERVEKTTYSRISSEEKDISVSTFTVPDLPILPVAEINKDAPQPTLNKSRLASIDRSVMKPLSDEIHHSNSRLQDSFRSDSAEVNSWSDGKSYNSRTLTVVSSGNLGTESVAESLPTGVSSTARLINCDQFKDSESELRASSGYTAEDDSFMPEWSGKNSVSIFKQQSQTFGQPLNISFGLTESFVSLEDSTLQTTDIPAANIVITKQRPQTSVEDRLLEKSELQNVVKYFKQRPHTAVAKFKTEDVQAAFDEALIRYKHMLRSPLSSDKLYRNIDQAFSENWHERQIERHVLIRMQKELRAQNAQKSLLLMKYRKKDQWKLQMNEENVTAPEEKPAPDISSHVTQRARAVQSAKQTINIPAPTPVSFRPHTAHVSYGQNSPQPHKQNWVKLPSATYQQQAGSGHTGQHELQGKVKPGYGKTYRLKLQQEIHGHDSDEIMKNANLSQKFDPWLLDPRNPCAVRPISSKSIPNKCHQYILVSKPKMKDDFPWPTPLEEYLLALRFPHQGERIYKKCLKSQLAKPFRQSCIGFE